MAVWVLALLPLAARATAQVIRLEDIVAGGDGSGSAPAANVGIDPRTGAFVTSYFNGHLADSDGINPSPVAGSRYIDSVFFLKGKVPTADDGCGGCFIQYATQSGVQLWLDDGEEIGTGWNYILKDRVGGVSEPGIRVGGTSGFGTAIGMHSSMGITFNLDTLRSTHGADAVGCFSTFWGMDDCAGGFVTMIAFVSNDASGVLDYRDHTFSEGGGDFLRMPIPAAARYLTLITLATGMDACDHATFARPVIAPLPCPPDTSPWVWSVPKGRVPPSGGQITVQGEFLDLAVHFRVSGVFLSDLFGSAGERRLGVPAFPAGVYDLEVFSGSFELISKLPRAIEVAPPPVVTRIVPVDVLYDRPTRVTILGENLRRDMAFDVRGIGEDSTELPISDISFESESRMTGTLPAWEDVLFAPDAAGLVYSPQINLYDQTRVLFLPAGLVTYHGTGIDAAEPNIVSTAGGTVVTFDGVNLAAGMQLKLGGLPLSDVQVLDSERIRGTSPALPLGLHPAELVSSGGQTIFVLADAVTAVLPGPPEIVSVEPAKVLSLGGTLVTITMSGAHNGALARVAGVPLINTEVIDGRTLRGEVPPLPLGRHKVDIVDRNEDAIAAQQAALEVVADEQIGITAVSPSIISTLGGTVVTLTGIGFSPSFEARLGGLLLTDVEVLSSTTLRGISPALEPGSKDASLNAMKIEIARQAEAVNAKRPDVPANLYIGHVRPSRMISGTSIVRVVGTDLLPDLVPRLGGHELDSSHWVSPCRIEGTVPSLAPGTYKLDLYRRDFGIVAEFDELVEVAGAGVPPRPDYIVSEPIRRDGSTRLFVFGNDFSSNTVITVGGKPLVDASVITDELIVGRAPPLDSLEPAGLRDLVATDERGSSKLPSGLRYSEAQGEVNFLRGDTNESGRIDLSDAVFVLGYLFLGNPTRLACLDAADVDASLSISLTDAIYLLQHLFLGAPQPPGPYPDCGAAPGPALGCDSFPACGGGGGAAASPVFYDNVRLIDEFPATDADPQVVQIAAEGNEIVVRDPPGGKEIQIGDVIAGFTPVRSEAMHNGVAYMLKVLGVSAGSCLTPGPGEKVYRVRPAKLAEALRDGEVLYQEVDFAGAKLRGNTFRYCADVIGAGGVAGGGAGAGTGAEMGSGGVGEGLFFDFDAGSFDVLNKREGDSYLRAGFHQCRIKYSSGINLGLGIGGGSVARMTFFAGILLDSAVEFFVDAGVFGQIQKDVTVAKLQKGTIIFIGPVPISLTAGIALKAGVALEGGATMYLDVGAQAGFKAGFGFELSGNGLKDLSGFEPPHIDTLPDTPNLLLDGSARARAYIRPEISLSGGLLIKAVTAELQVNGEVSGSAHAEGTSNPYCINWGLDAGLKISLGTLVEIFGFDVLRLEPTPLDELWPDFLTGKLGCLKYRPVVVVKNTVESTPTGLLIHCDASGSYDPDGGPLNFVWDFDADGFCVRDTGSSPFTTFTWNPEQGSVCDANQGQCAHWIRVRVTDDEKTFREASTSFLTENKLGVQTRFYPRPILGH